MLQCASLTSSLLLTVTYRLLQTLVAVRYLLMFGVVRHCGRLTRAEHPVMLASLLRSSSESKSETYERYISCTDGVCNVSVNSACLVLNYIFEVLHYSHILKS